MGRLKTSWIASWILSTLPFSVAAQVGGANVGSSAVDLIRLHSVSIAVPLRYAGVVKDSELIDLNGRELKRGDDYTIDYDSGMVSLMVPQKPGDVVRVQYRYDRSKATTGTTSALPTFKFDMLGNGSLGGVLGLGMAERGSDGKVVLSNIFGFNNSFSLGNGAVKGLMLYSDRQNVDSEGLDPGRLPGGAKALTPQSKHSKLILQNFQSKLFGGTVEASYQDVGQGFTGFGAVKSNGYDQSTVDQLQKEKGLSRMSFGFKDLGFGDLKLSNGFRTIKDGNAGITWRNLGFKMGGFNVAMNSQKVDNQFTRFKDLSETDRDQLAKEKGLMRENLAADFTQGKNVLGFTSFKVEDDAGHSIERREASIKTTQFAMSAGSQSYDQGFTRLGSLTQPEIAKYSLDAGLKRRWEDLTLGFIGGKTTPLHFNTYTVESATGEFSAQDISVGFKDFSLSHFDRKVSAGFKNVGNLQPGEIDASIANIAAMYDPSLKASPQDRALFVGSRGLERNGWTFKTEALHGWNVGYSTLRLKGTSDDAGLDILSLKSKNFNLRWQQEKTGEQFKEMPTLMTFEQQRLGPILGLQKSDLAFDTKLAGTSIVFNQMQAHTAAGDAVRQSFALSSKNMDLSVTHRGVDKGFANVNQLVDPEKDVLFAMIGQKGTDAKLRWRPWKGMAVDAQSLDQQGNGIEKDRNLQNVNVVWTPNKRTELGYQYLRDQLDDPAKLLYYKHFSRFTLKEDLGKNTIFRFAKESLELAGTTNQAPSQEKTFWSFQTEVGKLAKLYSERTETNYDDGTKQTLMTNTVSAQLTPKAGVSVTDVRADNPGTQADTSHQDLGAWLILPNGMKLSFGDVRNTAGENLEETKNISVSPGQIGNMKVDSATYTDHYWDNALDPHRQAQSNVSLSTVKPFRFGPLWDMHFNFGFNALADRTKWQQENRLVGATAKLGTNALGFEYKGQMSTNGYRAIDRTFRFATDQKPNRFLSASFFYKLRTLPSDDQVMIRDISFTLRPTKTLEVSNHLITNPEVPNGNALLGSTPQPSHSDEWKLDYKKNPNFSFGASWLELRNEQNHALSRTGGVQCTLFEAKGSPLKLFYGLQQVDGNVPRSSQFRYSLQFDQKPGANQSFSFFVSNLSYANMLAQGTQRSNWTVRADYNFRF